jgi:TolA-binding protein
MYAQPNPFPWKILALLIAIVLGIGSFAYWQGRMISALRAENQALRVAAEEAERLRQENIQMKQWRALAGEVEKLRKDNQELNRLRNEIRQLRSQAPELEQLRAENQHLQVAGQQLLSQKTDVEKQLATTTAAPAAIVAAQAQAESTECIKRLTLQTLS